MNQTSSGVGALRERGAAIVLRLLPHVHHPPARVLLTDAGEGHEARALDARGYRVSVMGGGAAPGPGIAAAPGTFLDGLARGFDLVCETGSFWERGSGALEGADRARYVEAAANALRPGGLLFGAFPADDTGRLIALVSPRFDVARLEPSGALGGWLEAVFVRR